MISATDFEYLTERLDRDHIDGCATAARAAWDDGVPAFEVCYQPGDMTYYALLFTILRADVPILGAPGGGTGDRAPTTGTGCYPFDGHMAAVTYVQRESLAFLGRHDFASPDWVLSKMTDNVASAIALAVLLNAITEGAPEWEARLLEGLRETEAARG